MARILCIETSGGVASVALAIDGRCVALREEPGNEATHRLTTFIEEFSKGVMSNFDAVAVSAGPGSYTGLRIGVSLAKGLCYASGKPLVAVGTLDALVQGVGSVSEGIEQLVGLIDARRMEVYAAHFSPSKERTSDTTAVVVENRASLAIDAPQSTLLFGNGAAKCVEAIGGGVRVVEVPLSARWLCGVAEQKLNNGQTEDVAYFEPNYIKEFVALTSQKKLW